MVSINRKLTIGSGEERKTYNLRTTRTPTGIYINIGGGNKYCVQINVPFQGEVAELSWIESAYGCSFNNSKQEGKALVRLTMTGMKIAMTYNVNIQFFKLLDNAKFKCKLPDGNLVSVDMTQHDMAFYQQSYYEKRYGAILLSETEQNHYKTAIKGFTDPMKKPATFDFGPSELQTELQPFYDESLTWKEFFDKINLRYGSEKCIVIGLWLQKAVLHIMNNIPYSGRNWRIPINILKDTKNQFVYTIDDYTNSNYKKYSIYGLRKNGGGGKTRKRANTREEMSWIELFHMDWKGYFADKGKI